MRNPTFFSFLGTLTVAFAADCGTNSLNDIADSNTFTARNYQQNWWIAREALCLINDPCFDGKTDCTIRIVINSQKTLSLARWTPSGNADFQNCWDATQNIIEQCVKGDGKADGSWTLPDGAYKFSIEGSDPIPDVGGAPLPDPSQIPGPSPGSLSQDAYKVVCNVAGQRAWGFSGWANFDQISDPNLANTKGSSLSAPGDCNKVPNGAINQGIAFQGCGTYWVVIYERDDCKAGISPGPDTWSYAQYGPQWVAETRAIPYYKSWKVFNGMPGEPEKPS